MGEIRLELSRKAIKHLRIMVAPPDGQVRVSAPAHWSDRAVRAAVATRLPWIRRQQAIFAAQPRVCQPCFATGESHWLWGVAHRLELETTTGPARVEAVAGQRLRMLVRAGSDSAQRERLLNEWYRRQLRECVEAQLEPWQQALAVRVSDWGIKRMRTRWGTCNIGARRIWLNLALVKLPPECCEYVLVHELAHLLERYHNARFWAIVERHLPNWREARARLNSFDRLF